MDHRYIQNINNTQILIKKSKICQKKSKKCQKINNLPSNILSIVINVYLTTKYIIKCGIMIQLTICPTSWLPFDTDIKPSG